MKIIYLAAGYAKINKPEITYQDKYIKRDIADDMLKIDLSQYDLIIASPPCNYYSKANRRQNSAYSQETKNLLPDIIKKCENQEKPYIIENVINKKRMAKILLETKSWYYEIGRHCYFTSHMIQFKQPKINEKIIYKSKKERQGGTKVNEIFTWYIEMFQGRGDAK